MCAKHPARLVDMLSFVAWKLAVNMQHACLVALGSATLTAALLYINRNILEEPSLQTWWWAQPLFSSLTGIIGYLVALRVTEAQSRYWEAADCAFEVAGGLYSAASSLFAFSHFQKARRQEIDEFKHVVARLTSLLSATMFAQLENGDALDDVAYDILGMASLDTTSMKALAREVHKTELVIQWVKLVIINGLSTGLLSVPPPILTRAFHEIDMCVSKFHQAEKLSRVCFPTAYSITLQVILTLHVLVTPAAMINAMGSDYKSALATGGITFTLWSVHFLARDLEHPFVFAARDIDLKLLQTELNEKLSLACVVRSVDVPRLSVPLSLAVRHMARTTRQAMKSKSRMRRVGVAKLTSCQGQEEHEGQGKEREGREETAPAHSCVSFSDEVELSSSSPSVVLPGVFQWQGAQPPIKNDCEIERGGGKVPPEIVGGNVGGTRSSTNTRCSAERFATDGMVSGVKGANHPAEVEGGHWDDR